MTVDPPQPPIRVARRRARWALLALVGVVVIAALVLLSLRRADAALMRADPDRILADAALRDRALVDGKSGYARYCASCHGEAGQPDPLHGVPDLRDREFLYGEGLVSEIEQIVLHGIRAQDKRGWNLASMPAYAQANPYKGEPLPPMTPAQVADMTQFLLSYSGRSTDAAAAARGGAAYNGRSGCWDCHGQDASGDTAIGAPNLTDNVWLYGGDPATIKQTLTQGRAGVSPAFARVIAPVTARSIAVYVASLAQPAPTRTTP